MANGKNIDGENRWINEHYEGESKFGKGVMEGDEKYQSVDLDDTDRVAIPAAVAFLHHKDLSLKTEKSSFSGDDWSISLS